MAILLFRISRPPARSALCDPALASQESLLQGPGSINYGPIDRANTILLLKFGNLRRGVGCIAPAAADAIEPGRQIGYEKEADKPDVQIARGGADRNSFNFMRKNRVHDDGMALRKRSNGALHKNFVDLASHCRLVGAARQPLGFMDLKMLFSQDVAAQHDRSGLGCDQRG